MREAVILTFRDIERTGALEARMRDVAERLRRHHDDITQCHITIEDRLDDGPETAPYAAKIHLSLPGAQIHADSVGPGGQGYRDLYSALRAAYASASRQLQDLKLDRGKSSLLEDARSMMGAGERTEHRQRSKA
ncbi:MAG: HPF/RaiA family ribosome-associated protein [Steroidobacteraceae bacterium]